MPNQLAVDRLLQNHALISDQVDQRELRVILSELSRSLDILPNSSVVELGCYIGTTSLFIRRVLDARGSGADFHVYDSFQGLPEKTTNDLSPAGEQFREGELSVSRKVFEMQFKKAGLKLPTIHRAWFNELRPPDMPAAIGFAYLDGDYYESILDSFKAIEASLLPGATVVVDDYANEALPGAQKATNEWVRSRLGATLRVQASLAIIYT